MKERLDVLLVKRGFFPDKEKAQRAIMAGLVIVDEKKIDKSGTMIKLDKEPNIRIKGDSLKYVSRGGLKLEKAVSVFNIDFSGKKVLDVGASTGGFTDCALQNGAEFVYSVDVGTNQLDWKLRNNPQVKSLENMHIKDLTLEDIDNNKVDYIVMDVSFTSICLVSSFTIPPFAICSFSTSNCGFIRAISFVSGLKNLTKSPIIFFIEINETSITI